MAYHETGPDGHYEKLALVIIKYRIYRVLMGGLGNAELPKLLPSIHFVVVEKNCGMKCDLPNVEVHYGDWTKPWTWPEGKYDAIVSDMSGQSSARMAVLLHGDVYAIAPHFFAMLYDRKANPYIFHGTFE